MICENCGKEHNGLYGSGRFCCKSCQISFTNKQRGNRSEETKRKISNTLKQNKIRYCKFCGKSYIPQGKEKYCSHDCKIKYQYHVPTLIKYFTFNKNLLGTKEAIKEYDRIKNMLYDLYWNKQMTSSDIAIKFNYTSHICNITNKVFKMLNIPSRNCTDATNLNILTGKLQYTFSNNFYKQQWHTTWNNKRVFLRSSYEENYAELLDSKQIDYFVESIRIRYYDSQLHKIRIAIPDFYIPSTNTIVEIKSNWTLDIQNMKDKFREYKKLGYNTKLILEGKEKNLT